MDGITAIAVDISLAIPLTSTMTKTIQDKAKIADAFFIGLTKDQQCFSFTDRNNPMGYNCCSKFGCDLEAVKSFFHKLVYEYWSVKCPHFQNLLPTKIFLHKLMKEIDLHLLRENNLQFFEKILYIPFKS